ncbi:uncharacterized protein LOC135950704 [Calliphora vicina]|uniref:uncharacterized protein LOC135950704 n=1 Tax=Calliphora vicina TaxID=7373 RepID=UPI00325BAABE
MPKIVALVFLMLAVAVVKGEYHIIPLFSTDTVTNSSAVHMDAYLNLNRQQHEKDIDEIDKEIEIFKQSYDASLDIINKKLDLLVKSLVQTDAKLNPLVVISELSKTCVSKYRYSIPTVTSTKNLIADCINTASYKLPTILVSAINTRNDLENFYKNTFENNILNCEREFGKFHGNYSSCITNVVADTTTKTLISQKTFEDEMAQVECIAAATIKVALDCSYAIEHLTITEIARATAFINNCMVGQDNCKPCLEYTCADVYYMERSEIDGDSKVINNPFYGQTDLNDCVMLKVN